MRLPTYILAALIASLFSRAALTLEAASGRVCEVLKHPREYMDQTFMFKGRSSMACMRRTSCQRRSACDSLATPVKKGFVRAVM